MYIYVICFKIPVFLAKKAIPIILQEYKLHCKCTTFILNYQMIFAFCVKLSVFHMFSALYGGETKMMSRWWLGCGYRNLVQMVHIYVCCMHHLHHSHHFHR